MQPNYVPHQPQSNYTFQSDYRFYQPQSNYAPCGLQSNYVPHEPQLFNEPYWPESNYASHQPQYTTPHPHYYTTYMTPPNYCRPHSFNCRTPHPNFFPPYEGPSHYNYSTAPPTNYCAKCKCHDGYKINKLIAKEYIYVDTQPVNPQSKFVPGIEPYPQCLQQHQQQQEEQMPGLAITCTPQQMDAPEAPLPIIVS